MAHRTCQLELCASSYGIFDVAVDPLNLRAADDGAKRHYAQVIRSPTGNDVDGLGYWNFSVGGAATRRWRAH